jgi:hypothetical protein
VARYKLLHWLSHPQPPTSIDIVRWLMVFDNAANPDALRDYLPSNGPGSILITSRRPGFRISHLRSSYFDLDPFTPDESVDFMRGATRRLQAETSQVETEALRSIADRLGGLPLALAHISSFILSRDLTFAEFLNRYDTSNGRTSILNEGPRIGKYENSLATTWDVSFSKLTQGAMALLDVLCFLDPDHILDTIIRNPRGALSLQDYPSSDQSYFAACNELLDLHLIKGSKQNDGQILSIHRVIQEVRKEKMDEIQRLDTIHTVAQLVALCWIFQALQNHHSLARVAQCSAMVSHVIHIHEAWRSTGNFGFATVDDLKNCVSVAVLFNDTGLYVV